MFHASKIVIGLDTGTQHIAAFEGSDVITITSCWNFDNTWSPSGAGKIITIKGKNSKSCLLNIDNLGRRACTNNPQCIESVSVIDVICAINKLI